MNQENVMRREQPVTSSPTLFCVPTIPDIHVVCTSFFKLYVFIRRYFRSSFQIAHGLKIGKKLKCC